MKYTQYRIECRESIPANESFSLIGKVCNKVNQNLLASGLGIHYESDPCYLQTKAEGEAYEAYRALSEHYQGLTRVISESGEF